MKKTVKILVTVGASVLLGVLAVLFSNMGVISHASARTYVDEVSFLKTTVADSANRYTLVFNDAGNSRGRYISRLLLEIFPEAEKPSDLVFTVRMAGEKPGYDYDRTADLSVAHLSDKNPIYVTNEVLDLNMENVISVTVEGQNGSRFTLGNVTIDNSFRWNWYVFCFGLCLGLAVCLVIVPCITALFGLVRGSRNPDGNRTAKRVAAAYLLLSLTFGTLLVFALPENKVGYDEETHLQAVLQMASFPGEMHVSDGVIHQVTVTEFNNPDAQPKGPEEQREHAANLAADADYKMGDRSHHFYVMANRMPAYLPMAVVMKACKGLSLSWPNILRAVRLANLYVFIALMTFALAILPRGQVLLFVIGLLPQNLFLGATVSYDPFITGCLSVGLAFLFRILEDTGEGKELSVKSAAGMLVFLLLGCLVKAVYAPLVLAAFLVPKTAFRNKRSRTLYLAAAAAVFLLTVVLFIVPTLVAPSASGDVRGGETVSEASQLSVILGAPFAYAGLLLSQMAAYFRPYFCGPDCSTLLGHIITPFSEFKGYWVPYFLMMLLPAAFGWIRYAAEKKAGSPHFLNVPRKLWLLFLCFGAAALVWTAMYVAFTPAGWPLILGVQGRYFIPLMFPAYFAFGSDGPADCADAGPRIARAEQIWYDITIMTMAVLTALSLWTCVLSRYCV